MRAHVDLSRDPDAEVPPPRLRPGDGRWRRAGVALLVVLSCVTLVGGVVGLWARRNFLDTDRFVERVGPLIDDPAVQTAVSVRVTDQVMRLVDPQALFQDALPERGRVLAVPLSNAVEGFVGDRVVAFLQTDQAERVWRTAVTLAHGTAVRVLRDESDAVVAADGQVTLDLLPVVNGVLQELTSSTPELFGRTVELPDVTVDDVPDAVIARLEDRFGVELGDDLGQVTVYDRGRVEAAQDAVRLLDRLAVVLLPLGLLLAAAALWLSRHRRRTLLQLLAGLAIGMVLTRRLAFRVHDSVVDLPPTAEGRGAIGAVVDQFLDPLTTFAALALVGIATVSAAALVTGDHPWAVALRGRVGALRQQAASGGDAGADTTVAWVRAHRDGLLVSAALVGLVLLWAADLSWVGLLLLVASLAAVVVVIARVGTPPRPAASP